MRKIFPLTVVICIRNILVCFLALTSFKGTAQQRVFFSDSLEQRAEVNKIKIQSDFNPSTPQGLDYQNMKMGKISLGSFEKYTESEILAFSQEKKKSPFLLRLLVNQSLVDKDIYTNAEIKITDQLSYDLMGVGGREASIVAIREANKKVNDLQLKSSTLSNVAPDTSYLKAEILIGEKKKLCTVDVLFQNEGAKSIQGIAVYGSDTLFISTTDKAIKYHALGVEVRNNKRVIAGMQLPDMHIGPSYTLVDKSIPNDLRTVAYGILSIVLYCNENRE